MASACLFQAPCLAHRVRVRLCPREMYRVFLEVCLLEVAWLSALLQVFRHHQVHPMVGFPLRARQQQLAEERSSGSQS